MERITDTLKSSSLCSHMDEEDVINLLKNPHSRIKVFKKGEYIFREEDVPDKILVLLSGSVVIAKDTLSGKRMILARITTPGELFGEVYAFMELSCYDMYAEAMERTVVFSLEQEMFTDTRSDQMNIIGILRNNLMKIFAKKSYALNRRLRIMGSSSIREKIVRFLVEQENHRGRISIPFSREEMADCLNVTRPSLSRELSNMAKEEILRIEGRDLVILDQKKLEEYL